MFTPSAPVFCTSLTIFVIKVVRALVLDKKVVLFVEPKFVATNITLTPLLWAVVKSVLSGQPCLFVKLPVEGSNSNEKKAIWVKRSH